MLKKLALAVLAVVVVLNLVLVAIALLSSRDRDLTVADTAIEFEEAVFGGNYEAMWDLAAPEFRDGLTREQFVQRARENAPPQDRIFDWTALNETADDIARTHTRLQLARGGINTNRMLMRNIEGEWRITDYRSYEGPWPPDEPPLSGT